MAPSGRSGAAHISKLLSGDLAVAFIGGSWGTYVWSDWSDTAFSIVCICKEKRKKWLVLLSLHCMKIRYSIVFRLGWYFCQKDLQLMIFCGLARSCNYSNKAIPVVFCKSLLRFTCSYLFNYRILLAFSLLFFFVCVTASKNEEHIVLHPLGTHKQAIHTLFRLAISHMKTGYLVKFTLIKLFQGISFTVIFKLWLGKF